MAIDRLEDFHVFVTVAERGNFSAAARLMRLSPSTVSKAIARVEKRLGVRVFDRSSKTAATLTREGEVYLEQVRRVIDAVADVDALADSLTRVPQGTVRVHTRPSLARHALVPLIPAFMAQYPDLRLNFRLGPRFNTLTDDMDVALVFGALSDSALVARRVASFRRTLCAAPSYLARHPAPTSLAQLADHQLLSYSLPGRETWSLLDGGTPRLVKVDAWLSADQADLLLELTRSGMGITQLPEFQLMADFQSGQLVPLLPECGATEPLYIVYRKQRTLSPRVRTFIDFVAERFRDAPWNLSRG